jgi:stage IV sporulation protein FB
VFLQEPTPTRADLNFNLLGFHVRVHPLFWLITVLLAWSPGASIPPQVLLLWVVSVFVCILVHELGHAWMARYYGASAHIVLYSFGGLASYSPSPRNVWNRVAIALAGPGAGFLFAALILAAIAATGRKITLELDLFPFRFDPFDDPNVNRLIINLLFINWLWGLFNLLPIYPLDGGQVSRNLFMRYDWRDGLRKAGWLSIGVAVALAVYLLRESGGRPGFNVMMLGYLAFLNYQEMNPRGPRSPW